MSISRIVTIAVGTMLVVAAVGAGLGTVPLAGAASDATNSPPVADAGDDRSVDEGATVHLDARDSTDPDDDVVTHTWTQTDGPPVTLSDPHATTPQFTAPTVDVETTLTFVVEARDGSGGNDTDSVTITVMPTNDRPRADAGADRTVEGTASVRLDASGSTDPNGDELSYSWHQVAGTGVTLVGADTASASFTAPPVDAPVVVVLEATVTDGDGASDTDTVNVTVNPADAPTYTRDELSQATYGYDFDALSSESASEIEELYLRQPFTEATSPAAVQTRDALAQERYGASMGALDRQATIETQSVYDAQFGDIGENTEYTRDDIAQAKYAHDFSELSTETAGQVEELYDRQPFANGLAPGTVRTREELSAATYGVAYDDLSRESRLTIERMYDAQFGTPAASVNFSVTALSATATAAEDETVVVTARIVNHGAKTGTQTVELRLDPGENETAETDDALANESLSLDPSANASVNFTVPVDAVETGASLYVVSSGNDNRSAELDSETLSTVVANSDTPADVEDGHTVTGGDEDENVTEDENPVGPVSEPRVRDGATVVTLSELRANHRYDVNFGESVAANTVTVTGQELLLRRSDESASLRVSADEETVGDAPALTGSLAYLRVDADGLADADLREVDFEFHVPLSTLEAADIGPNEVRIYRYHDGTWESYDTIHRGEGQFESGNVPGLSAFAIAPAGASAVTPTETAAATTTPTSPSEPTQTPTPSPAVTDTPSDGETESSTTPVEETATQTVAEETTATPAPTTSTTFPGFTPHTVLLSVVVTAFVAYHRRRR